MSQRPRLGTDLMVIRANPPDVAPFVETARSHADRERDALGFLPGAVYGREICKQGGL